MKTDYKRDYFHSNIDVDFDFAGPVIHGAWVLGYITSVSVIIAVILVTNVRGKLIGQSIL